MVQNRLRPNKVRFLGIIQTIFDRIKLLTKSKVFSSNFYKIFDFCPLIFIIFVIFNWIFLNLNFCKYFYTFNLILIFLIMILYCYPNIFARWRSVSIFRNIGSFRRVVQILSYDIVIIFLIIIFIILTFTYNFNLLNFYTFLNYNLIIFVIIFIWFFIRLTELNRTPFDLIEGESELVSRYNTEYGRGGFTLLFLREYINIWLIHRFLVSLIFLSNFYIIIFNLLLRIFITSLNIFIRASYPRIKFNEIVNIFWEILVFLIIFILFLIFI